MGCFVLLILSVPNVTGSSSKEKDISTDNIFVANYALVTSVGYSHKLEHTVN